MIHQITFIYITLDSHSSNHLHSTRSSTDHALCCEARKPTASSPRNPSPESRKTWGKREGWKSLLCVQCFAVYQTRLGQTDIKRVYPFSDTIRRWRTSFLSCFQSSRYVCSHLIFDHVENYHGTAGERLSCQRSFDPPLTLDTHTYPTNNRHETVDVLDFGQNQSSLPEDRATNLTSDPNHIAPQSVVRFPHCAPSKPKTVGRTPRLALSPSVYTRYRRTSRSAHTPFTTTHTPSPTSIHNVLAHHSPTPLLVPQDMSSYSYPTHFQPHQPLNTFHDFSTGSKRTSWANNRPQRSSLLPRSKTKRSTTSSSDQALYETAESELDSTTNFGRPPNRSHDRAPRAPELTYDTGMDSSGDSDNKNVGNWCLGQRSTSNLPYFWPFSTGEEQVTFRNHPGAMQCEAAVQTSRINSIQPVVSDVISPYSSFPQLLSGEVIANHHQPMEMEDQISDGENWARYYWSFFFSSFFFGNSKYQCS